MKRFFAIVMLALTVLSVSGVILYTVHKNRSVGGGVPEIRFEQDEISIQTGAGYQEMLQGVTASDAEDGDVTDSVMVESVSKFIEKDVVNATYVAYDSQNHVSRATRRVRYSNYQSPRFSMSGPMVFLSKNVGDMMNYVGVSDVIDGDISLKAHASFDDTSSTLAAAGEHKVEISVTNSLGDTARLLIPVKVMEDTPHSEMIPLKDYLVYVAKGSQFDPAYYLADASQAEADPLTGASSVQIDSKVNTVTAGVYTVDYSIIRNEVTAAVTRLIVVVE